MRRHKRRVERRRNEPVRRCLTVGAHIKVWVMRGDRRVKHLVTIVAMDDPSLLTVETDSGVQYRTGRLSVV